MADPARPSEMRTRRTNRSASTTLGGNQDRLRWPPAGGAGRSRARRSRICWGAIQGLGQQVGAEATGSQGGRDHLVRSSAGPRRSPCSPAGVMTRRWLTEATSSSGQLHQRDPAVGGLDGDTTPEPAAASQGIEHRFRPGRWRGCGLGALGRRRASQRADAQRPTGALSVDVHPDVRQLIQGLLPRAPSSPKPRLSG